MKRTINEIYGIIKLHKDKLLNILHENINESRNKLFNDIKTSKDIDMNDYSALLQDGDLLKVKIDLYEDILNLIEESGVLEDEKIKDKALELACYYIEYKCPKQDDDIYYRKAQELEMIFINQAKEELRIEE